MKIKEDSNSVKVKGEGSPPPNPKVYMDVLKLRGCIAYSPGFKVKLIFLRTFIRMGKGLLFKEFLILARDGAEKILNRAVDMVSKATEQLGKDAQITFPGTVYGLPLIYGLTGRKPGTLEELRGELVSTKLLAMKKDELTSLYNSGLAALMAMEVSEAVKYSTVRDYPKPYL
ncbi:MAG: hypothetical protein ACP5K1_06320, partial [Candidatus Bathyarchaeia archaeon]